MAEITPEKWAEIQAGAFANESPPNWPKNVKALTWNGHTLFGMDRNTRELFWDGQRLITEKRFSSFERTLAVAGLLLAGIGVIAAVIQAWAAISPPASTTNFQRCIDQHQFILGTGFDEPANRAKVLDSCIAAFS